MFVCICSKINTVISFENHFIKFTVTSFRAIPAVAFYRIFFGQSIWHSFWHSIWNLFWYFFGILFDINSDILCGILVPSAVCFWHYFRHWFWRSIWHLFSHSLWHSVWHLGPCAPTASRAGNIVLGSRHAPQHLELAIWCLGPACPTVQKEDGSDGSEWRTE